MSRLFTARRAAGLVLSCGLAASSQAMGANASRVVSYDGGTNRFQFSSYTNPEVALGAPQTKTGPTFPVTPFNNPFSNKDVVSVGLGGSLVLQLSNHAVPVAGEPEIGVFTFQQFLQVNGGTNGGPSSFYPSIRAVVDVSADGVNWTSLQGGELIAFDVPANAFKDTSATVPSDYGLPYTGGLEALRNRSSLGDVIAAYGGSGGGTWLDISGAGLPYVDYVRFSVPASAAFSFQLDALSVSTAATGTVVPEPAVGLLLFVVVAISRRSRRR